MESYSLKKVLDLIKHQVPLGILTIQWILAKYIWTQCHLPAAEGGGIGANGFAIIITTIGILFVTIMWTVLHTRDSFIKTYGVPAANDIEMQKSLSRYVILHTISSCLAYIAISYYMQEGHPFNCLFPYNQVIAYCLLGLSAAYIGLFAWIEQRYWTKAEHQNVPISPNGSSGSSERLNPLR